MTHPDGTRLPLSDVSDRIDALEGHLAQLLARQRDRLPASDPSTRSGAAPVAGPSEASSSQTGRGDASAGATSGRIVRSDLQFDEVDDADGFDERFTTFTDNTDVDERSRNWLLS